jgi:hypothetical protein
MEQVLLQYGALGVMVLGLGLTVIHLYKANTGLWKQLLDVQEARRTEAVETSKELTQTLSTFSQNTSLLIDKIVEGKKR